MLFQCVRMLTASTCVLCTNFSMHDCSEWGWMCCVAWGGVLTTHAHDDGSVCIDALHGNVMSGNVNSA